jgi:hypothetical protein
MLHICQASAALDSLIRIYEQCSLIICYVEQCGNSIRLADRRESSFIIVAQLRYSLLLSVMSISFSQFIMDIKNIHTQNIGWCALLPG